MKQDMILIIDLGSNYNAQLAREIRELGVYSEINNFDITEAELSQLPNVKGIILNGGKISYSKTIPTTAINNCLFSYKLTISS